MEQEFSRTLHAEFGRGVAYVFLAIALLGIVYWVRNRDPGAFFWRLLALAQVGVGIQILLGLFLLATTEGGDRPEWLHYAYGLFPVLTLAVAHRYSQRAKGLEWVAFSIVGLVNFGLMYRGFMTGPVNA